MAFVSPCSFISSFRHAHELKLWHRRPQVDPFSLSTQTLRMCENARAGPPSSSVPSNNNTEVCTYCHNKNIVECPVCEGRGYHGRTITCYYCRGAKQIECPLCADDIYKFSYVEPANPTIDFDETDEIDES